MYLYKYFQILFPCIQTSLSRAFQFLQLSRNHKSLGNKHVGEKYFFAIFCAKKFSNYILCINNGIKLNSQDKTAWGTT